MTNHGAILCNMGKPQRKPEPNAVRKYFQSTGIPILGEITAPGTIEGGDMFWLDDKSHQLPSK